jgi:hypothetical protein
MNSGVIETQGDGAAGIVMCGGDNQLINSGRIIADGGEFDGDPLGLVRAAAVVVTGDNALIQNCRSGVIMSENADSAAVELNIIEQDGLPTADLSCRLENFGLINGAGIAVLAGAGAETVVNHGRIVGDVVLATAPTSSCPAKAVRSPATSFLAAATTLSSSRMVLARRALRISAPDQAPAMSSMSRRFSRVSLI